MGADALQKIYLRILVTAPPPGPKLSLLNAMLWKGVPLRLAWAWIQEMSLLEATPTLEGVGLGRVSILRGGIQGRSDTPKAFNHLIEFVASPLVLEWNAKGWAR